MDFSDLGLLGLILGEFFVERPDKESRLYTNLTSLKREHRSFIVFDGSPILMTDLVNSQVVFSVAVVENQFKIKSGKRAYTAPLQFVRYKELALIGVFYESLAQTASISLDSSNRAHFKRSFYREVFFSRVRSKGGSVKKAFQKDFSVVLKVINEIKKGNHAKFAIRLQRMEASIFIDKALKQLIKENKLALSIHDSIVVSRFEDLMYAEQLISQAMEEKYGLKPKFKRE